MGTVVFLVGPKAVGKSWAGVILQEALDIFHVDADPLIRAWFAAGITPDPADGWLAWVQPEVERALTLHNAVSVEATGAWESDFKLGDNLESLGNRVLRIRLTAPEVETIMRMKARTTPSPIPEQVARHIYRDAAAHDAGRAWDFVYDTSGEPQPEAFVAAIAPLLYDPQV